MIGVIATKIVQINAECGVGSTGKIAVAISKLLNKKGVENYIFYSGNHKSSYENGIMLSGKLSIRIHQILSRIFGDQGFHSYFSTKRMVKKIKKIAPDVILLHNLHGYYLHVGVLFRFLKRYGKPVYWTFHDCWPFTGHCAHFMVEKCDKWKEGCYDCVRKDKYPYSWFFDRSNRLYKRKKELFTSLEDLTIITPSEWLADIVKESFFRDFPVLVINNGINLDVFKHTHGNFKEKNHIGSKLIILGVSAVWNYYKGLDIFLELYKRLDPSIYQIVLVGTDETVDKDLPEGIISIHRTNNQAELAEIYSSADVFVNPTREDNYPTVNMEAIACGTPVVTFDTGGCKEIVTEACGVVTANNTVDRLIDGIFKVIENRNTYANMCEFRAKDFDEKKCFEEYIENLCR
jgi:glycosyltransferase involved in cell wall biosynthesis